MTISRCFAPLKSATLLVLLIRMSDLQKASAKFLGSVTPYVFTQSLSSFPVLKAPDDTLEPIEFNPRRQYGDREETRNLQAISKLQELPNTKSSANVSLKQRRATTNSLLNFAGIPFQGGAPPDPVGDIGRSYYIQMTNSGPGSAVQVFDKANGFTVAGPFALSSLANPVQGVCRNGKGDPIVLYDQFADRWLLTEFASGANALCVYVSRTSDPINGGWYSYEFLTPNFPDYPKYGIQNNAYYVGTNEQSPKVPALYALERSQMLSGGVSKYFRNTGPRLTGFSFQITAPIDADGETLPPASPGIFVRHNDDESHSASPDPTQDFIEIFEYDVDFGTNTDVVTGPIQIGVNEFDSDLCGLVSFSCIPQPGTGILLDPLREPIMHRPQYRNFGTYEAIVLTWTTDVNGNDRAAVRWAELRRVGGLGNPWRVYQDGLHSPDATNSRFMPSIAMDGRGNIALGYSISSSTTFPGIRYVGREAGDSLNTMTTGEQTIIDGPASQRSSNRYGDYSAMTVDPIDDCTFWYTNEYIAPNGRWATQIASFLFPSCLAPSNDDCVDAIDLGTLTGPPLNAIGATDGATVDSGFPNPCNQPPDPLLPDTITSPGVWYTFTSDLPCISASTCFGITNYDSKVSVYAGDICGSLVCVDGNDDAFGACWLQSFTGPFPATTMTRYYVLVHGFGGATGDFSLVISAANGCSKSKSKTKAPTLTKAGKKTRTLTKAGKKTRRARNLLKGYYDH